MTVIGTNRSSRPCNILNPVVKSSLVAFYVAVLIKKNYRWIGRRSAGLARQVEASGMYSSKGG